jgi:hypothetical protein
VGRDVIDDAGRVSLLHTNWLLSPHDNPVINGLAGVAASTVTTTVYNPVMVVRTRLQTAQASAGGISSRVRIGSICSELLRGEGWRGFFKGTTVNVGIAVVDGLLFAFLYEFTKLSSDVGVDALR